MLPNRISDPSEYQEVLAERLAAAHQQFKAGELTVPVYKATLFGLGVRGTEISSYVNLNWPGEAKLRAGALKFN